MGYFVAGESDTGERLNKRLFIVAKSLYVSEMKNMKIPTPAKEIVAKDPVVQVATSDKEGTPHIAAARGLQILDDESVTFEDWFCIQTLRNIEENPKVAVSLLEAGGRHGYQLIGTIVKSVTTEVLDGYLPLQEQHRIPHAKHRLHIKVEKVLMLSVGPHSDYP